MISAQEFLVSYFKARTELVAREIEALKPFRKQYFLDICLWESRPHAVELSRSERIVSIQETDGEAVILTESVKFSPKKRYELVRAAGGWLIRNIQPACAICDGAAGNRLCEICAGSGWLPLPGAN